MPPAPGGRFGGGSHDLVRAEDAPRHVDGQVALPQMDALGIHRHGNVQTVVDEQGHAVPPGQCVYLFGKGHIFPGGSVLLPQLQERYAAPQCFLRPAEELLLAETGAVGDEIQAGVKMLQW